MLPRCLCLHTHHQIENVRDCSTWGDVRDLLVVHKHAKENQGKSFFSRSHQRRRLWGTLCMCVPVTPHLPEDEVRDACMPVCVPVCVSLHENTIFSTILSSSLLPLAQQERRDKKVSLVCLIRSLILFAGQVVMRKKKEILCHTGKQETCPLN